MGKGLILESFYAMAFCGDVYKASAVSDDMHHLLHLASGLSVMVKLTICMSLESFYLV